MKRGMEAVLADLPKQAGKPAVSGALKTEYDSIAQALLAAEQ